MTPKRNTSTEKIDEALEKVHTLNTEIAVVKQRVRETEKDVARLISLFETLDKAFTRFKEQVEPVVKGAKAGVGLVIAAVLTALIALVVKTQ